MRRKGRQLDECLAGVQMRAEDHDGADDHGTQAMMTSPVFEHQAIPGLFVPTTGATGSGVVQNSQSGGPAASRRADSTQAAASIPAGSLASLAPGARSAFWYSPAT